MPDIDILKQRLQQAETAYHTLMMGGTVVEVRDQNGESIRYSQTNSARLSVYIESLKQQISGQFSSPAGIYI